MQWYILLYTNIYIVIYQILLYAICNGILRYCYMQYLQPMVKILLYAWDYLFLESNYKPLFWETIWETANHCFGK